MDMSQQWVEFILRWFHVLAGIAWIGLLYYFNFVQVPFFAETEAPVRTGAIAKLVPRALWWFRYAALVTFLTGLAIILWRVSEFGGGIMSQPWGITISIGALLGTVMFLNVWLVIWPNQKIVIASTIAASGGGAADPRAAGAGARAFLASRTNTLLSIPMAFFMVAASHLTFFSGRAIVPVLVIVALVAAIEANALLGTKGKGPAKLLEKHVTVIHLGIVLAIVFALLLRLLAG